MDHAWATATHKWWIVLISPMETFVFLHLKKTATLIFCPPVSFHSSLHSSKRCALNVFFTPYSPPHLRGRYGFPRGDLWPIGNQIKATFRTIIFRLWNGLFKPAVRGRRKERRRFKRSRQMVCVLLLCVCVCVVMACTSAICQVMEKVCQFLIGDVLFLFAYLLERSVNILRLETEVQLVFPSQSYIIA